MKNVEITDKNGHVVGIAQVHDNEELLVITEQGKILRTPANEIRTIGRATQGVRLMDLEGDDKIVSVALVEKAEDEPLPTGGRRPRSRRRGPRRAVVRHRIQEATDDANHAASRPRCVLAPVALLVDRPARGRPSSSS